MNKIIVAILSTMIIVSFSYLAILERRQEDLSYNKNWWSVYFQSPKDSSMDFTIENHSNKESFEWKITDENGHEILKESLSLSKGSQENISIEMPVDTGSGKIIIRISDGKNEKYIYKIF